MAEKDTKIKAFPDLNFTEIFNYFEEIGFKKNHAKTYLALLKFGQLGMRDIVRRTGIQRSYVYDILDELTEKGLVGYYTKNKNRIYFADDPEKILEIINSKEEKIKIFKQKYSAILPNLISVTPLEGKNGLFAYEGRNGIKNIFEDMLKEGKDFVCFGGEGEFSKYFPEYAITFSLKSKAKNIGYKVVYSSSLRQKRPLPIQKKIKCNIKFLPKDYHYPFAIYVYGDKTAIILWQSMTAILIKSQSTAKGFEDYFDMIWKIAKE
ncbi:MAG TPA: helix-turn-helix domain-containing protein [Candidatus Diapherotrites archaeon]|jgi:sugar-specific transcriptional regulator TrmB|nr:helix-turn-helix domain-containing protein [Candidatus Diapherotrites archaeon]